MKQNTFYILAGIVGLIEVGVFWLSVQYLMPLLISAVFIAGIVLLYGAWRRLPTVRWMNGPPSSTRKQEWRRSWYSG